MSEDLENIKNLDIMINKLNDELGIMGNNLIEKQIELDYLREINEKLNKINKKLLEQIKPKIKMDIIWQNF